MPSQTGFGQFISLDEAIKYISDFRKQNPDAIRCYSASGEKLREILDQENCIGVRIYNGYSEEDKSNNLVILGVDKDDNDMCEGLILERLTTCPPKCNGSSPLCSE